MNHRPLNPGDVHAAHVLRDTYGMNAENRPIIEVNEREVPEELRFLIPRVERWAIRCDVTRNDYFEKQPPEDIVAFWNEVLPHVDAINAWLDTQPADVAQWPEAAIHFMYFLKAHAGAWQPTDEEKKEVEKRRAEADQRQQLKQAIDLGLAAFRNQKYPEVVEILTPFVEKLDKVTGAKLAFARKKVQG